MELHDTLHCVSDHRSGSRAWGVREGSRRVTAVPRACHGRLAAVSRNLAGGRAGSRRLTGIVYLKIAKSGSGAYQPFAFSARASGWGRSLTELRPNSSRKRLVVP